MTLSFDYLGFRKSSYDERKKSYSPPYLLQIVG
jgi:hypothetical protein